MANGHREMWTRQGKCVLARVSKSGLVGWTRGKWFHPTQGLANNTVVIAREDKVLARITAFYPFINLWDFADGDSCVIVLSRGPHGPGHFQKFRIKDGKSLGASYESEGDNRPDWATRFLEKAYREGTYVE